MFKKDDLLNEFLNQLKKIPLKKTKAIHEPQIDREDKVTINKCIERNEVSAAGNYVKNFEKALINFTGSKYAIATSTGTSAIHLALQSMGVNENHEVLIPAFNFIASANAILYCNATPHFVDINKTNLTLDLEYLDKYLKKISFKKNKNFINRKTKKIIYAIIPVYIFGNSYDVQKLKKLSRKYNLKIIEDSAEALGTFYRNKHAGTFGDAGCLSFNGNKIITTGMGGAVITDNYKIYKNIRNKVNNGKKNNTFELVYQEKTLNLRMASINAALGISQMKKINSLLRYKRKLSKKYLHLFKNSNRIRFLCENIHTKSNNWLNAVVLDFKNNNQRTLLFKKAQQLKIPIRPAWVPLNKLNYLKNFPKSKLNITNNIYKKIVCLPSSSILGK